MEWVALAMAGVIAWGVYRISQREDTTGETPGSTGTDLTLMLIKARDALDRGDTEDALALCDRILAQQPDHKQTLITRGSALSALERYPEELANLNHLIRVDPQTPFWYVERGWTHHQLEDPENALRDMDQALAMHYEVPGFAYELRSIICNTLGRDDEALEASRKGVLCASEERQGAAIKHFLAAATDYIERFLTQRDYERVLRATNQALEYAPDEPELLFKRSIAHDRLKHPVEALAELDAVIRLQSTYPNPYNYRAWLLASMGRLDESLKDSQRAIELNNEDASFYDTQAQTVYLMGRYAEALRDYGRALELNPRLYLAIAGQAVTQHALGNLEAAKSLWRELIELDARYENVDALVEDFHPAEAFIEAARKLSAEI